jgi:glc operon protein GlcG
MRRPYARPFDRSGKSCQPAEGVHRCRSMGAVPIIRNGVVQGACGVGGGTSQQDEAVAKAAVAKL